MKQEGPALKPALSHPFPELRFPEMFCSVRSMNAMAAATSAHPGYPGSPSDTAPAGVGTSPRCSSGLAAPSQYSVPFSRWHFCAFRWGMHSELGEVHCSESALGTGSLCNLPVKHSAKGKAKGIFSVMCTHLRVYNYSVDTSESA